MAEAVAIVYDLVEVDKKECKLCENGDYEASEYDSLCSDCRKGLLWL